VRTPSVGADGMSVSPLCQLLTIGEITIYRYRNGESKGAGFLAQMGESNEEMAMARLERFAELGDSHDSERPAVIEAVLTLQLAATLYFDAAFRFSAGAAGTGCAASFPSS
jgi:hypothetical protein